MDLNVYGERDAQPRQRGAQLGGIARWHVAAAAHVERAQRGGAVGDESAARTAAVAFREAVK